MEARRVPYAEAEKSYPRTQNRYDGLQDESEYPGLTDSEETQPLYTGATRKSHRTKGVRRATAGSNTSRENSVLSIRRESRTSYSVVAEGNPHRATEIERLLAQLRQDILRLCRVQLWMEPIIAVQKKLSQRIQQERTEIETDQLLIEVSMQLETIIKNGRLEVNTENRSTNNSNGQ